MRGRWFRALLVLACYSLATAVYGQTADANYKRVGELRRQAFLGAALSSPSSVKAGATVRRITDANVAAKTGLRQGDLILRINGTLLDSPLTFNRIVPALRAGDATRFEVLRDGQLLQFTTTLLPLPNEQLKGVKTDYGSVLTDLGFRVRTIVTRPQNARGKLPVVFLVGWLSCDSVEYPFGTAGDGFGQLLHDVALQSGHVLVRVDKPGIGDSEGPSCPETDFQTELAAYRAAFRALKNYEFVDPERIFILGLSNGAGFAPLVPQDEKVRGYIVAGGWSKTWFEHMLELERRRLRLMGKNHGEVTDAMRGYEEFYTDYLVRKMTPRQVLTAKPHLASLWYDAPEHQYGRPASFYHQLQDLNLAAAWEKVRTPVLVMHGEYDWIMSRDDHELIAEIVNSKTPGSATFINLPKTDHLLVSFENMEKAFQGDSSGQYNRAATEQVMKFLQTNR